MWIDKRFIRHYVVLGLIAGLAIATLWRYGSLASRGGSQRAERAAVPIRGPIYDREGRLLAVDTDLYDVSVWKPSLDKGREAEYSAALAEALAVDGAAILSILEDRSRDFDYLARRVSGDKAGAAEKAIERLGLYGVRLDRVPGRVYPERALAAHLVGFVGTENTGLAGAEAAFDAELSAPGSTEAGAAYSYGSSVYLSIDADLQYRLETLGRAALAENAAEALALVAVEARSGAVLAYVSLPDFDPNAFLESDRSSWVDRVSMYAYEPGSVFKVYSMSSLIALGGIDEESSFRCDGKYERTMASGEQVIIKCLGNHGIVNLTKILEYSCNSGAAYASDTVSAIDFYSKVREFGFGERPGADLAGENPGLIRQPADWSGRTKPTIAIGQELLVTALQMAGAGTVLANGGLLVRTRTLDRIVDGSGQTVEDPEPIVVRRVMDERDARAVLSAMEASVLETGTGKRARIDDIRMSVKTGTAQMIDPETRRYSDTDFIASTMALFPSESPEYIVYAAIFKPKGSSIFGGRIAAPLVKDAANAIADLYGVARSGSTMVRHSGQVVVGRVEAVTIGRSMPDLRGVPKRALTPLLERTDIAVEVEGEGWVAEQSPEPGQPVEPGMTVRLRLR